MNGVEYNPPAAGIETVIIKGGSQIDTITVNQMPSTLNQSYGVVVNGEGGADTIMLNAYDTARRFIDGANANTTINAVETGSAAYLANAENATVFVNADQYGAASVAFYDGKGVGNLYLWSGGSVLIQAPTVVYGTYANNGGNLAVSPGVTFTP